MSHFIDNETYNRGVAVIAELKPCPIAGKVTADQIKTALGEALDIWPVSIEGDCRKDLH